MAMETVVPDVLGYISEKAFITPEHPGQDTNVVYAKDEQKAIILYMNELDKSELTRDVVVRAQVRRLTTLLMNKSQTCSNKVMNLSTWLCRSL